VNTSIVPVKCARGSDVSLIQASEKSRQKSWPKGLWRVQEGTGWRPERQRGHLAGSARGAIHRYVETSSDRSFQSSQNSQNLANVQPQSPEQGGVEDGTKASSSNVEPHVPPSNPPVTDARVTPSSADAGAKEPHQPVTASTVQDISKASSSNAAQEQVPPSVLPVTDAQAGPAGADPGAKEPQQLTESAVQQAPALSTSQRLWNDAYDSLENDNDTAELVKSYMKTLTTVLKAEKAPDTSASGDSDVSAELKDPTTRQMHMKKLVEEGQAKVSTASKIMRGVGDVAQFILSAKGMIDLAIQNIPQAALPWAGVCVGLQVRNHPSITWFPCQLISIRSS
jgi:hypothetical protein